MHRTALPVLVVLASLLATRASAQQRVQYDTLSGESPAAISCGFCGGEKFGMVFRPLDSGGGLRASDFPLTLDAVEVGVARTQVTGSILSGGYTCSGTSGGGTVSMQIEVYAGTTPPRGSISDYPREAWPGETQVFAESAQLELSVETTPGSAMYEVMITSVPVGVRVDAPSTYLRVAVTIPSGGSTSSSCMELGLPTPGAVGLRDDDGRIESHVGFIYAVEALGGAVPAGWHWNESSQISDPSSGASGIAGDWAIRLEVTPQGAPGDAGVRADAGVTADASVELDGGDRGCVMDRDCAGGERCTAGECVRVACSVPSDCAGGTTCVGSMCRALCTADAECRGGEVCNRSAGHCAPVGEGDGDGGCGCRAAGVGSRAPGSLLVLLGLAHFVVRRRRR